MKKTLLIAISGALFATACSSDQKKAEELVKVCLQKRLNDPKSYESVAFSKVSKLKDTIFPSQLGTMDSVHYYGKYEIAHTYRSKNALGGTITESKVFQIDSAMTEATCCWIGQRVVAPQ